MPEWRNLYQKRLKEIGEAGTVHDIGGGAQRIATDVFRKGHVVVDADAAYKPDVVADIQHLPFGDDQLDAVICLSVLEHVERPWDGVRELHRVLKPGAPLLVTVPFIWPYHADPPHYQDYWRFSRDALVSLFKPFSSVEIVPMGGYFSAMANFVPSFLKVDRWLRPAAFWLDDRLPKRTTAPSYMVFARK